MRNQGAIRQHIIKVPHLQTRTQRNQSRTPANWEMMHRKGFNFRKNHLQHRESEPGLGFVKNQNLKYQSDASDPEIVEQHLNQMINLMRCWYSQVKEEITRGDSSIHPKRGPLRMVILGKQEDSEDGQRDFSEEPVNNGTYDWCWMQSSEIWRISAMLSQETDHLKLASNQQSRPVGSSVLSSITRPGNFRKSGTSGSQLSFQENSETVNQVQTKGRRMLIIKELLIYSKQFDQRTRMKHQETRITD